MGLAVGHSELVYICVQFLRTISFFPFLFFFFFLAMQLAGYSPTRDQTYVLCSAILES